MAEVGQHRWVVSYSGDADNQPAATECGDEDLLVDVDPATVVAMQMVKSAEFVDVDGIPAGDAVHYRFTIDNTGTVEMPSGRDGSFAMSVARCWRLVATTGSRAAQCNGSNQRAV